MLEGCVWDGCVGGMCWEGGVGKINSVCIYIIFIC